MEPTGDPQFDDPTEPATDEEQERERLRRQAAARGIDEAAALDLAERVHHLEPLAEAYRAVERRLATGHSLEEAEEILLGEPPTGE
jgi:hypothetical protein